MQVKIYKEMKTAAQSGNKKQRWVLETMVNKSSSYFVDPLMGWNGVTDTSKQIILYFNEKDEAISFAKNNNMEILPMLEDDKKRPIVKKSYLKNFN